MGYGQKEPGQKEPGPKWVGQKEPTHKLRDPMLPLQAVVVDHLQAKINKTADSTNQMQCNWTTASWFFMFFFSSFWRSPPPRQKEENRSSIMAVAMSHNPYYCL